MGPADLREALEGLRAGKRDRRVLVDHGTLDDAGVFAYGRGEAWVQTIDFFTPVVDDPHDFGRIAAANALSDVYAMGGRPLTALSVLCVPDGLPAGTVREIVRGGAGAMAKAGVSVIGGHSVRDPELKFGYAVTGVVPRRRMLTNAGARPGDRMLLTKPLGTGILSTALKEGRLAAAAVRRLTRHMAALNRVAAEAAMAHGARAATDVTGYGLVGHGVQLAEASRVTLRLRPDPSWLLPQVLAFARQDVRPGGQERNRAFFAARVDAVGVEAPMMDALFDPQTSGGLLLAVPPKRAGALVAALRRRRSWVAEVGEAVKPGPRPLVLVDG